MRFLLKSYHKLKDISGVAGTEKECFDSFEGMFVSLNDAMREGKIQKTKHTTRTRI